MEEGNKCRILLREAKEKKYSVYHYCQREAQMAKNVTSEADDSVAKLQVCKIGFDPCKFCLNAIYFIITSPGGLPGRHYQREKPVIRFGCLKNLSTESNVCVQHVEGMQDRYTRKKCP